MPKARQRVTPQTLRSLLHYCEDTGHFYWKECSNPDILKTQTSYSHHLNKIGRRADRKISTLKIMRITLFGALLPANRVAFMIKTGRRPHDGYVITHLDGNPYNNRWANLKELPVSDVNGRGRPSTSGHRGVSWFKKLSVWQAYINVNKKPKHLGWHKDKADAIAARRAAEARYKKS